MKPRTHEPRATVKLPFTEFYRAHRDEVLRFARRYGGAHLDVENIVAEAWARACARWSTINDPRPWVYRVVINLTHQAQKEVQLTSPSNVPSVHGGARWRSAAQLPGAEWGARVREIADCLQQLPDQQRAAVLLEYRGWSRSEIADLLGCTTITVRGHLHRGRAKLRKLLDEPQPLTQQAPSTGLEGRTA